jgi:type VII secretion-associated serine protease mycosin
VNVGAGRRLTVVTLPLILWTVIGQLFFPGPVSADETRDRQWHLRYLDITAAHEISRGDGVIVGVVDSGVDAKHPDLSGAILAGTNFVGGDGRVDGNGHGTKMAGLIAARGQPGGNGTLGIAPGAQVLPIDAGINNFDSPRGIDWAVQNGARVISLSLGGSGEGDHLKASVERAIAADVVVVAAAGNRPEDKSVLYPARYPDVVAVAGVDRNGNHADVSVTGPEIDIAAPAVDIVGPGLNRGYPTGTGTSDATAIVAGVAALIRSKYPQLRAPEVIRRLTATATDKGPPGHDDEYGFGVVNPVGALTANVPAATTPSADSAQPPSEDPGDSTFDPVAVVLLSMFVIGAIAIAIGTVVAVRRSRRAGRSVPPSTVHVPGRGPPSP